MSALTAATGGERIRRGYASGKADYLSRLRKIEGQVRETPALSAAASSASTLGCSRNGVISGYGRAGGTIAGRSDRDPRPRDRGGSPRPGRPQAGRSRQRDRDIQDRRLAMTAPPATAMGTSAVDHVAAWLADANHSIHAIAPARTRTNATSDRRTLSLSPVHQRRTQPLPARSS
jgi:hypothetical protein